MEYENTNESAMQDTNISREEAVKKVKELYELIKKIKIKYRIFLWIQHIY